MIRFMDVLMGTFQLIAIVLLLMGNPLKFIQSVIQVSCLGVKLNVDVAIESTGVFTVASSDRGGYLSHIDAGAKKVILTVPAKDDIDTIVLGVNNDDYRSDVKAWSNASCTTNCLAPIG